MTGISNICANPYFWCVCFFPAGLWFMSAAQGIWKWMACLAALQVWPVLFCRTVVEQLCFSFEIRPNKLEASATAYCWHVFFQSISSKIVSYFCFQKQRSTLIVIFFFFLSCPDWPRVWQFVYSEGLINPKLRWHFQAKTWDWGTRIFHLLCSQQWGLG